jgi:hypothetical protein
MQRMMTIKIVKAVLVLTCLGLLGTSTAMAQEKIKKFYIQAQAMGQAQQLGRSYSVTLIIEELSTAEDQKALFEAFQQKGNEGVVNALSKMHSKGRLSITGTLGYDVNYIRKFSMPDGSTKYRVVTDRPLRVGEVWADTRSSDYNLSGMEVILSSQKGKNSGTLFPALQFSVDKENHIQLEIFQNPWKLVNIMKR